MKPDLVFGADIVSNLYFWPLGPFSSNIRAQLYHPDMIVPFLATLNIALRASKSPIGGTAYLVLTVRSADLLNSFLLALCGSKSFTSLISRSTDSSNPQRTMTCQPKNYHSLVAIVASHSWNNLKELIRKSECIKSISLYNTTCSLHQFRYRIKLIPIP